MLGRVADQLYWMGRYSERTENLARILDVADRMTLTPQPDETRRSAWASALEVAGAVNSTDPNFELPTAHRWSFEWSRPTSRIEGPRIVPVPYLKEAPRTFRDTEYGEGALVAA